MFVEPVEGELLRLGALLVVGAVVLDAFDGDELLDPRGPFVGQGPEDPGGLSKTIKDSAVEPDQKKGNCAYCGAEKVAQLEAILKK